MSEARPPQTRWRWPPPGHLPADLPAGGPSHAGQALPLPSTKCFEIYLKIHVAGVCRVRGKALLRLCAPFGRLTTPLSAAGSIGGGSCRARAGATAGCSFLDAANLRLEARRRRRCCVTELCSVNLTFPTFQLLAAAMNPVPVAISEYHTRLPCSELMLHKFRPRHLHHSASSLIGLNLGVHMLIRERVERARIRSGERFHEEPSARNAHTTTRYCAVTRSAAPQDCSH